MMKCIGLDQYRAAKAHSEFFIEILKVLHGDLIEIGFTPTTEPGMI